MSSMYTSAFSRSRSFILRNLVRLAILVVFLGLWEALSGSYLSPLLYSSPSAIFGNLWSITKTGEIWFYTEVTLYETIVGFILGASSGLAVGIILGVNNRIASILDPFILALYALPKIVLAPLLFIWFGVGYYSKIAMAFLLVFFLVFYATFAGIREVEQDLVNVLKVMGASRRQVLWKVVIPSGLTYVFVGLRTSMPYALIGAVVSEFLASSTGLGYYVAYEAGIFDTAGVFAGTFVLMAIGVALDIVITRTQSRMQRWKPPTAF